jgi:hypothetical protein
MDACASTSADWLGRKLEEWVGPGSFSGLHGMLDSAMPDRGLVRAWDEAWSDRFDDYLPCTVSLSKPATR